MLMQFPSQFDFELGRPRTVQGGMIQNLGHPAIDGRIIVPEQNGSKGGVKIEIIVAVGVSQVSALSFTKDKMGREFPGGAGNSARDQLTSFFKEGFTGGRFQSSAPLAGIQ
jgi:hypothetical protein